MSSQKNKLKTEKSLFLRLHSQQAIAWQTWSRLAFDRARELERPVLLVIGHASCHWCEAMRTDSFEEATTAGVINERFVPILVDRDERPDVNAIYMDAVQMMTRQSGWPLVVFLTPDQEPFLGGCYFSAVARNGQPSLLQMLVAASIAYRNEKEKVLERSQRVFQYLSARGRDFNLRNLPLAKSADEREPQDALEFLKDVASANVLTLLGSADHQWGGFEGPVKMVALPRLFALQKSELPAAKKHLNLSLRNLIAGAIFDPVEGGLFRQSRDATWNVPRFEKLLSDNAALLELLGVQAAREQEGDFFTRAFSQTFDYLQEGLFDSHRGVYMSAECADSPSSDDQELSDGVYYRVRKADLDAAFANDPALLRFAQLYFHMTPQFCLKDEPETWILRRPVNDTDFCQRCGYSLEEMTELHDRAVQKLRELRRNRERPLRDSKAVLAHNCLVVRAFLISGMALADEQLVSAGLRLLNKLLAAYVSAGSLAHVWFEDDARAQGVANADDACELAAVLRLAWEHTQEKSFERALDFVLQWIHEHLVDDAAGTLYYCSAQSDLPLRPLVIDEGTHVSCQSRLVEAVMSPFPLEKKRDSLLLGAALGSTALVAKEVAQSCPYLLELVNSASFSG